MNSVKVQITKSSQFEGTELNLSDNSQKIVRRKAVTLGNIMRLLQYQENQTTWLDYPETAKYPIFYKMKIDTIVMFLFFFVSVFFIFCFCRCVCVFYVRLQTSFSHTLHTKHNAQK